MSPASPAERESDRSTRLLAAVLAISLLFAAAVLTLNSLDIADAPLCTDEQALAAEAGGKDPVECYEESSERRVVTVACGIAGAVVALLAAGVGCWIAGTGRSSRYLMPLTGAALVLGGASILIDNL